MKPQLLFAVVIACLLAGCAKMPTRPEIAGADYGTPMDASTCHRLAKGVVLARLKDPYSAVVAMQGPCVRGWVRGTPTLYGYVQFGAVNGKNSYGGYVGAKAFSVLMRDGVVISSCIDARDSYCSMASTSFPKLAKEKVDAYSRKRASEAEADKDRHDKMIDLMLKMGQKQLEEEDADKKADQQKLNAAFQMACAKMKQANAKHPHDTAKNAHNEALLENMKALLSANGGQDLHCEDGGP